MLLETEKLHIFCVLETKEYITNVMYNIMI